jgi:hypothetical protein
MKIVRKNNTHVKGRPVVAKAPDELNDTDLFNAQLLPYLLYHKATEKEQKKFRLLLHRIYYNGRKVGRKEMKDQMLDLWERLKELKPEVIKEIA